MISNNFRAVLWALVSLCCLAAGAASAQTSSGGPELCLTCHNEPPASNILDSPHGNRENPATPFAQDGCESCHGNSADHARDLLAPGVVFSLESETYPTSDTGLQNRMCLACHEADDRALREAGIHRGEGLACAACHTIHDASP